MKTAIDKNESELDKMKREAMEWIERRGKAAPPFISVAINAFASQSQAVTPSDEEIEKQYPTKFKKHYTALSISEIEDIDHNNLRQEGAKWMRSQLKQGYPQEFVEWLCFGSHPFIAWYENDNERFFSDEVNPKKWTLPELYTYWQNEINK